MRTHAIVIVNQEGVIQHLSEGAEALFGHAATDCIGRTLDVLIPSEYRPRHWPAFRAAIERGALRFDPAAANIPVMCADRTVRRFPGRLLVLRDALGQVIGAMGIFAPQNDDASRLPDLR